MNSADFFTRNYKALRPDYTPMKWMRRIFLRLIDGQNPSLIDLPTGAGKTELIVVWLVALAWYAQHRGTAKAVPRRLIWVVNRRVLVQQVFDVADDVAKILNKAHSEAATELTGQLRSLCQQDSEAVFNVVQLRGQRLDDRAWSLNPTIPQLIIGTVDQIGSRLLFQGYGLGKWSRPMHAGLFGVDAWVCVDEAHLVPAFAVTLRQIREMACRPLADAVPAPITKFFDQLPFWITELSATPGLPPPKYGEVFRLELEDEADDVIASRLLAKKSRRVVWKPQKDGRKLADELAAEALQIAGQVPGSAIAVFCRTAKDAEAIAKKIGATYKDQVLPVTGRIRGYERDRLKENELFQRFCEGHPEVHAADAPPTFLVGTAAAEVGLDADASTIVCDFADLLTLIQRLGRLDRRGQLSKRVEAAKTSPPTMTIIGGSDGKTTQTQLTALAEKLGELRPANDFEYGADFFTGAPWSVVVGKEKGDTDDEANDSTTEAGQDKGGAKPGVDDAVASATWRILSLPSKMTSAKAEKQPQPEVVAAPTEGAETPASHQDTDLQTASSVAARTHEIRHPADWLNDPRASITAGPVVVPPLTDAVLRRWAATTPRTSRFLPVHPWLYGLLPDDEGTPLMGIAFRLELDILQHCRQPDEDDGDTDHTWEKVGKVLDAFPPLNSELHYVPLDKARAWLHALADEQRPAMAHFDGEEWTSSIFPDELNSNSVLVLPTSTSSLVMNDIVDKGGSESDVQRCWDVLEALSKGGAKYWRTVTIKSGHIKQGQKGAQNVYRVAESVNAGEPTEFTGEEDKGLGTTLDETKWKPAGLKLSFAKDGTAFDLSYFKLRRDADGVLDLLPDHLKAAAKHGRQLSQALAPDNPHLAALLERTLADHDKGKDHLKWQQAMGNTPSWRKEERERVSEHLEAKGRGEESPDVILVAKPVIENPGDAGGYRHEWGTLWRIKDDTNLIFPDADPPTAAFLRDLYLHGIAAHHGYFRPSMPDRGFDSPPTMTKQNPLRIEAIERSARLQVQLGYWRLAYLESLIKIPDVAASRDAQTEQATDES